MNHTSVFVFSLAFVFCASCGPQNKPDAPKEKIGSDTASMSISKGVDTRDEYTDTDGKHIIIQNSFPRGGPIRDTNGQEYFKVIFWTQLINETDGSLDLKIDFPADSFKVPWLTGKYYKILVLPDTMTTEREALYDYGLAGLEAFLNSNVLWSSSLHRTIKSKGSTGFYVVIFSRKNEGAPGAMRTALSIKGQDVFYTVSLDKGPPNARTKEIEIPCGSISLHNLPLEDQ